MAKIGSLTVDLTLKSAEFIRDLSKSSQAVATNTQRMTKSVNALAAGFGIFFSEKLLKKIEGVTAESLKLAAAMHGPLAESAQKFLVQFEELHTALELGIAAGFLDSVNGGLLNTSANLTQATNAGRIFGHVIGTIASDAATFFGKELPGFIKEVIAQYDELQRVALDFSQLLHGDLTVLTGGISSFAKTTPGKPETEALAQYGSAAEIAALSTEQFWSATVTATAHGEELLRTLDAQNKILTALQTPSEAYALAIERIAAANLTGADAARAHSAATATLVGNYLDLADNIGTALGTLFKESKAVAIAQAVINTAQAITKTFAEYGATPWGFALAASMAAVGAAQIAAIASAQPGGSRALKVTKSAGGATAAAGASTSARAAPGQTVSINIVGDVFGPEHFRKIVAGINGVQRDGTALLQVA